jgi:hypothetical protein
MNIEYPFSMSNIGPRASHVTPKENKKDLRMFLRSVWIDGNE